MLDVFRNKGLSTIVYGVIIVGMVLVFVIQFNPSAGKKSASINQACVATVKGWCLDPKDHQAAVRLLAPRDGREMTTAQMTQLKKVALDGLIERELLVHEADRLGITVSDGEVTDNIFDGILHVSVPSDDPAKVSGLGAGDGRRYANFRDSKTKMFDNKVYERTIKNLVGRSPAEFREGQAREILAAKVRELVRTPVRVSEDEAQQRYIDEKSQAQIEQWVFKSAYFARWAATPTDADVAAFEADASNKTQLDALVDERKKDSLPVANHLRHILAKFDVKAKSGKADKDDGDEKDDKADKSRAVALAKVSLAVARIKAGAAFADVAREFSEDKGSALRGGDVGEKTDGFDPEFKAAADALKPGETTPDAIQSQFGFHVIEKDDPATSADVEAKLRKDAARELITKQKATDLAKKAAESLAAALKAGKTPEVALAELTASLGAGKVLPPLLPVRALTVKPEESADAGAETVTGDDAGATTGASDAGKSGAGATSGTKPPKAGAGAAKSNVPPPVMYDAATDPDRPTTETSSSFNRTGDAFPSLSPQASQKVNTFAFTGKENEVSEPIATDEGFTVLRVKQQKPATKEEFAKDRTQYMASLLALKQAEALATYTKRLLDASRADIKIDDTFLHPPTRDGGAPAPEEDEEAP